MVTAHHRTPTDEPSLGQAQSRGFGPLDCPAHVARATVLVVDDEPHLRELLRTVFEDEGFDVLCAANGEDAWDLWQHQSPSVVISDVMMPALDGYGLLRRLQDALETTRPPVILMTAAPPQTGSMPVPLVAKPFDIGELVTLVENVVGSGGVRARTAASDLPA